MRTLCDVCESAAAILFCAADEAALCRACDDKVHMCNKLASRHVRVGLAEPSEVPHCDICENAPAFFYCEIDGTSLCLQCDMIVHVGGKRTHGRYLLLRQRVEFPGDKSGSGSSDELGSQRVNLGESKRESTRMSALRVNENRVSAELRTYNNIESDGKMENMFIDLNAKPQRVDGQDPTNQVFVFNENGTLTYDRVGDSENRFDLFCYKERGNTLVDNNHELESVVPDGCLKRETEK